MSSDQIEIIVESGDAARSTRSATSLSDLFQDQGLPVPARVSSTPGAQSSGEILVFVGHLFASLIPGIKAFFMRGHQAEITIRHGKTTITLKNVQDVQAFELAMRAVASAPPAE